eukprot:GHVU01169839.1.p5 GENE.GHVU01169839.1~~GHVU01169839.1.p5  ORF type:complete len:111 (-),score=19.69 GHVU01169839.1:925-1257(-)
MEDGRAPDHDMPEAVSEDVDMEGAGGSTAVAVDGASGVPQGRNVEDGKDDDNACAQRANEQTDGAGNTETLSGGVAAGALVLRRVCCVAAERGALAAVAIASVTASSRNR